jgi:hypothetical protein
MLGAAHVTFGDGCARGRASLRPAPGDMFVMRVGGFFTLTLTSAGRGLEVLSTERRCMCFRLLCVLSRVRLILLPCAVHSPTQNLLNTRSWRKLTIRKTD